MVLPKRSTRGKRTTDLSGDELANHEDFWAQEAWEEFSDDEDVQSSEVEGSAAEDQEDSDIDAVDENEVEEEAERQAVEEERSLKKRKRTVNKSIPTHRNLRKAKKLKLKETKVNVSHTPFESDRKLRGSTNEQKQLSQKKQKTKKRRVSTSKSDLTLDKRTRKFSQNDFLREAVETENDSKRQLMALLMMQEEKKVVLQPENKYKKPRIRIKMNKLGTLISFPEEVKAKFIEFEKPKEIKKKRKSKPKLLKSASSLKIEVKP